MTTDNTAGGETPNADPASETLTTSASGETPGAKFTTLEDAHKEIERLANSLKRANSEAKQHREKATELDSLKKKIETDKLSETEKLQKQATDLQKAYEAAQAELQELKLSTSVATTAAKLGFADPDDAIKFLDKAELASESANVEGMLKDLLKNKPYLAGTQQTYRASSGGATNPSRSQTNASTINEQYVRDLLATPTGRETYARMSQAQRDEVQATLLKMNKGR